jgi:predicted phage baseplate assembly protein
LDAISLPVQRVVAEPEQNRTRVDFAKQPRSPAFAPPDLPTATLLLPGAAFNDRQVKDLILRRVWNESHLHAFITTHGWNAAHLVSHVAALIKSPPSPGEEGVFSFRQRVSFFGHNAPLYGSLPLASLMRDDPYPSETSDWDADGGRTIDQDSWGHDYALDYSGTHVFLERTVPEIVSGSWAVFTAVDLSRPYRITAASEATVVGYSLSAKATGLMVLDANGFGTSELTKFKVRRATADVQSDKEVLAQLPITDPLLAGDKSLMLDGLVLGLQAGQRVILTGERSDAQGVADVESFTLNSVLHIGGFTTLYFENGLRHGYIRHTVTLNANVATATHGESVREVLGSGDATKTYQSFTLRQPPLTHVSADTPSGAESTLKIYVNDVLWREVPFLYGRGSNDRVYVSRVDEDGQAIVRFGDGINGARLPTGQNNVRAQYRKGIGLGGLVRRRQLSQLLSRPLGLKGVINPQDAEGAEDPETLDQARRNAPNTVLTLDRAVSLKDYEDFARTFAGVAKAQAVWLWEGRRRSIFITVAGSEGATLDEDGKVIANLKGALRMAGDAYVALTVKSYRKVSFQVHGSVSVLPDHRPERVLRDVIEELRRAFSFEAREFGQPVVLSEVISSIHGVPGVIAVDIDKLFRHDDPVPDLHPRLDAEQPAIGPDGVAEPAELLLLDEPSLHHLIAGP